MDHVHVVTHLAARYRTSAVVLGRAAVPEHRSVLNKINPVENGPCNYKSSR
jgi:hypothetical protein